MLTPNCTGAVVQSIFRSAENVFPLPGRPAQSVHFVERCSSDAAWIATYSSGSTTATRFPFTTICVSGNCFLSSVPADTSFAPMAGGCTTRAWTIPGSRTSPT